MNMACISFAYLTCRSRRSYNWTLCLQVLNRHSTSPTRSRHSATLPVLLSVWKERTIITATSHDDNIFACSRRHVNVQTQCGAIIASYKKRHLLACIISIFLARNSSRIVGSNKKCHFTNLKAVSTHQETSQQDIFSRKKWWLAIHSHSNAPTKLPILTQKRPDITKKDSLKIIKLFLLPESA